MKWYIWSLICQVVFFVYSIKVNFMPGIILSIIGGVVYVLLLLSDIKGHKSDKKAINS